MGSKKCVILTHQGLGDTLTNCGIIRYYALMYDEVITNVKPELMDHHRILYEDLKNIVFISLPFNISTAYSDTQRIIKEYPDYKIIPLGYYRHKVLSYKGEFYKYFYIEAELPIEYRFTYMSIPRHIVEETEIKNMLVSDDRYFVIHEKSNEVSTRVKYNGLPVVNLKNWDRFQIPILYFCTLLENAEELHLCDSSYFCLATYLDLSRVKGLYVYWTHGRYKYNIKDYFNPTQNWTLVE